MSSERTVLALGRGGKDVVVIAPRDQLAAPSSVTLPAPPPAPGLILPDGTINWGCPCLGGMATGPCGNQFRDAFSCFHYSSEEPKGAECYERFSAMQACMARYPQLYGADDTLPDVGGGDVTPATPTQSPGADGDAAPTPSRAGPD